MSEQTPKLSPEQMLTADRRIESHYQNLVDAHDRSGGEHAPPADLQDSLSAARQQRMDRAAAHPQLTETAKSTGQQSWPRHYRENHAPGKF